MAFKTPGVYVQEISLFPPSVAEVETAVPAFIGYTEKAAKKGADLTNAIGEAGAYVEGIEVASHMIEHARRLGLETPISSTFVALSEGRISREDAIEALMERHVGKE